jgi:hypothetical protein
MLCKEANMGKRLWFEDLHRRLIRHDLPRSYVQRFMEEVTDHLEDLKEKTMGSEAEAYARLGQSEQVAEAAVAAYRRRSFLGRHPVAALLVFAVSPVISLGVLTSLTFVGLMALAVTAERLGLIDCNGIMRLGATARATLTYALTLAAIMVPSMILSFLYCGLARRTVVGRKWMVLPSGVLAVTAAAVYCQVTLSDMPGDGSIFIGLGARGMMQAVQFFVPPACGWWFIRRQHLRNPLQLAS